MKIKNGAKKSKVLRRSKKLEAKKPLTTGGHIEIMSSSFGSSNLS